MRGALKIFRIAGIDVKLHFSWWFIFALLAWSLSADYFPRQFPMLSKNAQLAAGVIAAILLFVSVLLHELSHSFVAKAAKIKVESITLFFFGGVAGIEKEDIKAKHEFFMALAGPLFSIVLGILFFFVSHSTVLPLPVLAVSFYLYQLNLILGIFNLVPGYPLDGGRVFRALLYWRMKDFVRATRIAVWGGKIVAGAMVLFGFAGLFLGFNGLWFIFLGAFMYFIAGLSYEQVLIKQALSTLHVRDLMKKNYVAVPSTLTLAALMRGYSHVEEESFLVKKGSKIVGIFDLRKIPALSRTEGRHHVVGELMIPLQQVKSLQPGDTAYDALKSSTEQDLELLPVIVNKKVVGAIARRTLMHYLTMELKYKMKMRN